MRMRPTWISFASSWLAAASFAAGAATPAGGAAAAATTGSHRRVLPQSRPPAAAPITRRMRSPRARIFDDLLNESIGGVLHLIGDLHRFGAGLVGALRRDQSDQLLHRAFVGHLEKALRDPTEAVLPRDAGLRLPPTLASVCRDSVRPVAGQTRVRKLMICNCPAWVGSVWLPTCTEMVPSGPTVMVLRILRDIDARHHHVTVQRHQLAVLVGAETAVAGIGDGSVGQREPAGKIRCPGSRHRVDCRCCRVRPR